MSSENKVNEYDCPGHEGVCVFCKEKEGRPRYVAGSVEIDRFGRPNIDACCRACGSNLANKKRFYKKTSIS